MSNITLTIPNDDHIALRAFGKALEEMALAHGAEPRKTIGELSYKLHIDTTDATAALERLRTAAEELRPEVDTTAQQVESLAVPGATHIITEQKLVGDPVPVGDDNFSQGYIATVGEIADPVDSTGTPWDERIHATSKALNADGTWRLRRKPKDMDEAEWAATVQRVQDELRFPQEPVAVTPPVLFAPENYAHMYRATDNIYALAKSDVELAEFEADGYVRHTQEQYDAWEGPNTVDEGDDHHTDTGVVSEQTVAGIPPLPVPPPVVVPPVNIGVYQGGAGTVGSGATGVEQDWTFPRLMTFLTERHGKIDVATVNTLLAQDGMLSVQELNAHPDKIGPFVARVKAHLGE